MSFKSNKLRQAIVMALMASTGSVLAQEAATEDAKSLDTIVVTGSNIRRTDSETASPVQVITKIEIERSGKPTVAEYLQTLTVDGQGSIPKSFGNGFASGGAGVSLRGLGAGSTLILINGRRIAPYGLADDGQKVFTDLSIIPMEAVERVEVLKDGASAIYGSDAIAGVVNIILRSDFDGLIGKTSYGTSEAGGGTMRKAALTIGGGDNSQGGLNAFLNIEGSKTDGVYLSERTNRKWIGTGDLRPWGYAIGGSSGLPGAISADHLSAGSSPVGAVRNPVTGLYESLPGCSDFSDVTPQDPNGGCVWDVAQFRMLSPDERAINLFGRMTYRTESGSLFYVEAGYSKKNNFFQTTPSGVSGTWGYPGGPVNASSGTGATMLGAAHPDNPFGAPARLRYTAFDVGPRSSKTENVFRRFLIGTTGEWGQWYYDGGYLHSDTDLTNKRKGFLQYSHVRTALTDPNSPVGYWRIGDDAWRNTQALYDYISPDVKSVGESSLDIVDFKANRPLMSLAGGDMGLGLGVEYRRQSNKLTPTTFTDIGDIIGLGYSAYDGTEEVGSAFAELVAPVLTNLELSAAVRVDKYKDGPSATTPKAGFKWKATDWLAIRGSYSEGFRAPNAAESGTGGVAAFSTASDSVRCPNGTPAPGGTAADCNAVPVAIIATGNPNLEPEKSKSYTFGLVLDPTQNTSMTLDLWQITRSNEINQGSSSQAIAAGHTIRADNNLPGLPNSGTLLAVLVDYINSEGTTVNGFDVDVRHKIDFSNSQLILDAQFSRVNKFDRTDGDLTHEFAGTHGNCDVTNCIGTPKNKLNLGATWNVGSYSFSAVGNYIGSMKNVYEQSDTACASQDAAGNDAPNGCRIPSFYTVDLSGHWRSKGGLEIFGSVQNVTDKIAPIDPLTYGALNYNPMHFSGAMGRYLTVGVKYNLK